MNKSYDIKTKATTLAFAALLMSHVLLTGCGNKNPYSHANELNKIQLLTNSVHLSTKYDIPKIIPSNKIIISDPLPPDLLHNNK